MPLFDVNVFLLDSWKLYSGLKFQYGMVNFLFVQRKINMRHEKKSLSVTQTCETQNQKF